MLRCPIGSMSVVLVIHQPRNETSNVVSLVPSLCLWDWSKVVILMIDLYQFKALL